MGTLQIENHSLPVENFKRKNAKFGFLVYECPLCVC